MTGAEASLCCLSELCDADGAIPAAVDDEKEEDGRDDGDSFSK